MKKYNLYKHLNIIKDWRKKIQIKLSTIIKGFFFMPVFGVKSFLQADQLFRKKKYKNLFNVKFRKHKTLISDTHMSNCLLHINSDELREVQYKIFEQTDKSLYEYNGLKIAAIDGSTFGKQYASVFQLISTKAPYVLDLEGYDTRGKELNASRNLVARLTDKFGNNFVDLIICDGLYKLKMLKFFKKKGMKTLIKTTEERLAPVVELESLLKSELGKKYIQKCKGNDWQRNEIYRISMMEYTWGKEKLNIAKVEETKTKPRRGTNPNSFFYVITNQLDLSLENMRELAKLRWNIENNGFKQLSAYAKTKHIYSKKWKVIENLMLIIFLSYNLMRMFKYLQERKGKFWEEEYGKMKMTFLHFVKMAGMLSVKKIGGDTS